MTSTLTPNAAATSGRSAMARVARPNRVLRTYQLAKPSTARLSAKFSNCRSPICTPPRWNCVNPISAGNGSGSGPLSTAMPFSAMIATPSVAITQRTNHKPFQHQTEKTGPDSAADQRDDDVVGDVQRRGEAGEHADHEYVGMGEVDHPQHGEHHGEADRDHGVGAADDESVQHLLQEQDHACGPLFMRVLPGRPPARSRSRRSRRLVR